MTWVPLLGTGRVDGDVEALSDGDRVVLSALAATPGAAVSDDSLCEALWGDEPPASRTEIVRGCISRLRRLLGSDAIITDDRGHRLALPDGVLDVRGGQSPVDVLLTRAPQVAQPDPEPAPPGEGPEGSPCPYPGMVPFDTGDAEEFFGRDAEVQQCLERIDRDGVLVVAGPSGCGKSSLVRAGVAASLRGRGLEVLVLTASEHVLGDLPRSRARPDVLVVDQLEAVTGPSVGPTVRDRILRAIAEHAYAGALVLVVRSDRLGDLATGPIAGLVERSLLLVAPLEGDALRAAVEGPAARAGLLVEPGLVDLLAREVEQAPGALPLLAHALRATWERREGDTLTVAGYRAAGGVRGAVAQTAEEVHDQLDGPTRSRLRELMLRMVVRADDGSLVAASVPRQQVAVDDAGRSLVVRLVARRLLVADRDRLRLAHEALTRGWPRLQLWLDEDLAGQRLLRHLTIAAAAWDAMGRPDSELYRGVRLDDVVAWREQAAPHLAPVEVEFLDEAVGHRQRERREVAARAARTERANRRLRRTVRLAAVLAVLAVVAGGIAGVAAIRADREALAADARRVGAQALLTDDVDTSLLLAVEAVALDDSPDTRASLLTALGRSPQLTGVVRAAGAGALGSVAVSPDGTTIATYDDANTVRFHDVASGDLRAAVRYDDAALATVPDVDSVAVTNTGRAAWSPEGRLVAVGVATLGPRPVRLIDATSLEEVPLQPSGLPPGDLLPWDVGWSPDGRRLAVVVEQYEADRLAPSPEGTVVLVWDLDDLTAPAVLATPPFTHSIAWSPGGDLLYAASDPSPLGAGGGATVVLDVASGEPLRTLDGIGHPIALSADGSRLAGVRDDAVVVVDASTGVPRGQLSDHDGVVRDMQFSADGRWLVTVGDDRRGLVWDATTFRLAERLEGHAGAVAGIAVTADGATLVTAGEDRVALVWDLQGDRRFVPLRTRAAEPPALGTVSPITPAAVVAPDGGAVAFVAAAPREVGGTVTTIQVLDVATGRLPPPRPAAGPGGSWRGATWIDEHRFATISRGGDLEVRDVDTGATEVVDALRGAMSIGRLGQSGDVLIAGANVVGLQVIDGTTLDELSPPTLLDGLGDVRLSPGVSRAMIGAPDGRTVAAFAGEFRRDAQLGVTATPSDVLVVLDARAAEVLSLVELGFDGLAAAYSPDGSSIAVGGRQGRVALVDSASGRLAMPPTAGHDGNVTSVAWVGEGEVFATGGEDGRVALWDEAGASLGALEVARTGRTVWVGPHADARSVTAVTADGEVLEIDTRPSRWTTAACAIAGRALTAAEWRAVAGERPYEPTCGG